VRHSYETLEFTAVDLFDGYYDRGADIITGCPVSRELFQDNLYLFHIPPSGIVIHQGSSQHEELKNQFIGQKFDMIFIDGDHSYDGMKADYAFSASLLSLGGLLIVDDYHSKNWPDVTRAVDDHLLVDPRFQQLGKVIGRTIVFRKTQ
jgi:hypothetical protein